MQKIMTHLVAVLTLLACPDFTTAYYGPGNLGLRAYQRLQNCYTAHGEPLQSEDCGNEFDLDADLDVDTDDYVLLYWRGIFASPPTYPIGDNPVLGSLEDLDGDGHIDIVLTQRPNNSVVVMWGTSSGKPEAESSYPAGSGPVSCATADLDNDGDFDLVVANETIDVVSILINTGDRTFSLTDQIPAGDEPKQVAVEDFNNDELLDLLTINCRSDDVTLMLNQGDGTFGSPISSFATDCPREMKVGDLDSDGLPDVVMRGSGGYIAILLNQGDATFSRSSRSTGCSLLALAVGDVDGDDDTDIMVGTEGSASCSRFTTFHNDGMGVFDYGQFFDVIFSPRYMAIEDINGDGHQDVAVSGQGSTYGDGLTFFINDGQGAYNRQPRYLTGDYPGWAERILFAHLDSDGFLDAVMSYAGNDVVTILHGGDYGFRSPAVYGWGSSVGIFPSDLDEDGDQDLVVGNATLSEINVLQNLGGGQFGQSTDYQTDSMRDMVAADFNGNGKKDYAVLLDRGVVLYSELVEGILEAGESLHLGFSTDYGVAGDVDGDGDTDLVTRERLGFQRTILQVLNDGNGSFITPGQAEIGSTREAPTIFDLDGDGDLDAAVPNRNTDEISVVLNHGNDIFRREYVLEVGDGPLSICAGDLDSNNWADLIVVNADTDTVSVLLGEENGYSERRDYDVSLDPRGGVLADITGDGLNDFVVTNWGSANLAVLANAGDGTLIVPESVETGDSPRSLATAELSGDSLTDLIVAGNDIRVYINGGGGSFNDSGTYDGSTFVAAGDVDGDGDADFITAGEYGGDFVVYLNGDDGTFSQHSILDLPDRTIHTGLLRDLDNDGDLDAITVGNALGSGAFLVYYNDGSGSFSEPEVYAFHNGSGEAFPPFSIAVSDWNGDGLPDVAVTSRLDESVVVFWNTGSSFRSNGIFSVGGRPFSIRLSDLDGDGDLDAVASHPTNVLGASNHKITILRNEGSGEYMTAGVYDIVGTGGRIEVGDLDGDGDQDLAVVSHNDDHFSVFLNVGSAQFAAAVSYSTTFDITQVLFGDMDGDLNLDAVVMYRTGNRFGILYGQGDGTFDPIMIESDTPDTPRNAALGDLNGDGHLDMVTATSTYRKITRRINNGTGSFGAPVELLFPSYVTNVMLADADGDGDLDIFATGDGSEKLAVFRNSGSGFFSSATIYDLLRNFGRLGLGDLDGDGDTDVVVAHKNSRIMSVLMNTGFGTFLGPIEAICGYDPVDIDVGDLDGDGDLDVATANWLVNYVAWYNNDGLGNLVFRDVHPVGVRPTAVVTGDLNNDGRDDLVVANESSADIVTIQSLGGGDFAPAIAYVTEGEPADVALADFDNDSTLDVVVTDAERHVMHIFSNDGAGLLSRKGSYGTGKGPGTCLSTDVNGDGLADVVVLRGQSDTMAAVINRGDARFDSPYFLEVGARPVSVASGDLDGDGDIDLAVIHSVSDYIRLFLNDGTGLLEEGTTMNTDREPIAIALADLDHDTDLDLVIGTIGSVQGGLVVFRNNGNATFGEATYYGNTRDHFSISIGDVDNDGDLDALTLEDPSTGQYNMILFKNDGNGDFGLGELVADSIFPRHARLADMNSDGNLDIAVSSQVRGVISMLYGDGSGAFNAKWRLTPPEHIGDFALGDLSSDGIDDLLTSVPSASAIDVRLGENDAFGAAVRLAVPGTPGSVDIRDFDGDGFNDVMVGADAKVVVYLGDGAGNLQAPLEYEMSGVTATFDLADFNGDGLADLVAGHPDDGTFSLRLGLDQLEFAAPLTFYVGLSHGIIKAADLDGDGDVEAITGGDGIAVFDNLSIP